jgi:AraC-like DNA-binding protein
MIKEGRQMRAGQFWGEIRPTAAATGELSVFHVIHTAGRLPRHSHESARIALMLEGCVTEITGEQIDLIQKGQITFWCEGSTHRDVFSPGTQSLQVELSHDVYRHLAPYMPQSPSPIACDRFEGAAERLLEEIEHFDEASPLALLGAVYEIVARAARLTTNARPESFAVTQATRYAREYLADPITLAELADAANVSVRRLHEQFSEELGATPMEYLRNLRLERAEMLLRETTLSSSDIAAQCGFYDHAHFCRLFKQRTGTTPGQFRHG